MGESGPKKSQFVGSTFVAKRRSGDICGSNGLPLMPNSIKILGRAQYLKSLQHPNLCAYLDIVRCKHERTIIVCEHVGEPLTTITHPLSEGVILCIAKDVLNGLLYLHGNGITHRALSRENLLLINKKIKLFNYGLFYMTGNGTDVLFPIGDLRYTAPEVFLSGVNGDTGHKADIWSLGVILCELVFVETFWQELSITEVIQKILSLIKLGSPDILLALAQDCDKSQYYHALSPDLIDFINKMLSVNPIDRPKAKELLNHKVFAPAATMPSSWLDNRPLSHTLNQLALNQLYHIWLLAGGDVFSDLKREGLIRTKAPILLMPTLLLLEGTSYGEERDHASILDLRVVHLFLGNLIKHFGALPESARYPLIECISGILKNDDICESSTLPLIIRERDTEYQFRRLTLFNRILESYPYKKELILKEARQDIPPLVRAQVWACLLEIDLNYKQKYIEIDKETPIATDRQIEVDIPRCHQYNELLSSSVGHKKFKRILKAWVVSHTQYVYWQGLDSLCAPFLFLNFNDEARAYACLSNFIKKYLHNFFLKDNSVIIREYLAKFKQLIAFHDPVLANHLHHIAFAPELYAIPWYLTMFSHVFPIHKILHLWDSLLIGDASYPLYVGLAILQQLRETLLSSGFNECILLFSDLPEIDIEKCVRESISYYCGTPSSVTFRAHEVRSSIAESMNMNLEMSAQSLAELLSEFCPRISGREFLEIYNNPSVRPKLVIVDIRELNEYECFSIPGSINIPFSKFDFSFEDGNEVTVPSSELNPLYGSKGKIIVVVGNDPKEIAKFGYFLVRHGFPKVCGLHGGINILNGSSILTEQL